MALASNTSNFVLRRARRPLAWSSPRRRGLNLTEVLVATFIAVTGVVFVAAMIPIGMVQLGAAIRADRGSVAAQQAWGEVEVRKWTQFIDANGVSTLQTAHATPVVVSPTVEPRNCGFLNINNGNRATALAKVAPYTGGTCGAFVIDPWGISGSNKLTMFPYPQGGAFTPGKQLPRLTIRVRNNSGYSTQSAQNASNAAVAMRWFTSADDPTFDQTDIDRFKRPLRVLSRKNSSTSVQDRDRPGQVNGDYTWMLSVSPAVSSAPNRQRATYSPYADTSDGGTSSQAVLVPTAYANEARYLDRPRGADVWDHHVSVVVFYRRPFPKQTSGNPYDQDEEFQGTAEFAATPTNGTSASAGAGVGEVTLDLGSSASTLPLDRLPKPVVGDWIMLYRRVRASRYDAATSSYVSDNTISAPTVARWYRIEAADPVVFDPSNVGANPKIRVTLKGPDWDFGLFDATTDSSGGLTKQNQTYFAYCKRVVAVSERTVRLEH